MIHQFAIRPSGGGTGGATASLLISAGASSDLRTDVTFANSNGVSFGLDAAGVVTATVQTNYLTTAMASNRGSDFVQATAAFHGTNASGTIASNAISVSVAAAANNSINISAGTTSSNVTAVTFSNGSGVSFGYDGTNITATVATNYQSQGAYLTTAMASDRGSDFVQASAAFAGTNASGTINSTGISVSVAAQSVNSVKFSAGTLTSNRTDITFSNSNGVSFGLETNGVITATVATNYQSQGAYLTTAALSQDSSKYAGTGFTTATTAGTAIVGTLNTSGLSMGVPAYLTAAGAATLSMFENIPLYQNTISRLQGAGSKLQVVPFLMPQVISVDFLRLPVSIVVNSASATGTSANTSFTLNRSYSHVMALHTQGTGANSLSLQYSTSTLATWVFQTAVTAGATGSRYTVSYNITYPTQGTTSLFQTNFATSDTQYDLSTGSLTAFAGLRFLDIPFAQSISPGNYWLALGSSMTHANPVAPVGLSSGIQSFQTIMETNNVSQFGYPGAATNSSIGIIPGMGEWSTNALVISTSSIGLQSITFQGGDNGRLYFQFLRYA